MIATGQIIFGRPLLQWEGVDVDQAKRLEDAGVVDISPVCGLIEIPLFISGPPPAMLYAYSVAAAKLSSVTRFLVKAENHDMDALERLLFSQEGASAMALHVRPSGHAASRKGWGSFLLEGYTTQPDDPCVFAGIFYEVSLDQDGEKMVFIPNSGHRHYEQGDLADTGVPGVAALPIWGYEEKLFSLTRTKGTS